MNETDGDPGDERDPDELTVEDFRKLISLRAQIRELDAEYDCFLRQLNGTRLRLEEARKRYDEALSKIMYPEP